MVNQEIKQRVTSALSFKGFSMDELYIKAIL